MTHSVETVLDEVEKVLVDEIGPGAANPNVLRQLREQVIANLKVSKKVEKTDKDKE